METVGYVAIGLLAAVLGVLLGVAVLFYLVKSVLHRTARGVVNQVVTRTVDRAMDAGIQGATALGKQVTEEMKKNDPRRIEGEVSRLAKERKGRVVVTDVMARLDVAQEVAQRTLEGMARRGVCRVTTEEGLAVFLFDSYRARRSVGACDYCGGTFDDADLSAPCPACGATLVARTVVAD